MPCVQERITQLAMAKQTVKGTPVTTGIYQIGVNNGAVSMVDNQEEELPITWSSRLLEGHDRIKVTPGSEFETLAMPKSIGQLLQAALGSDVITGAGPYTHTIAHANSLPYYTIMARRDGEYFRVADAAVEELELSWELAGMVKVKVKFFGCDFTFSGTTPYTAPTNDERPQSGVFKGVGGSINVDGDAAAVVKSGSIKISNSLEVIHGMDSVMPKDLCPATTKIDLSLSVVPSNTQQWRKVLTGSTSGTTILPVPLYGTAVVGFAVGANTLTFNFNRLKLATELPSVKAEGGPMELALEGSVANVTTGTAFNAVLVNTVATAY